MLLSGAWFSLEGAQPWVQNIAEIFPLTHMISATLAQVIPDVWVLSLISAVFLAIGAFVFKWE